MMEERRYPYQFIAMVLGSIVIAIILVAVSVALYFSSGTAQLDSSRPGFQSVRERAKSDDSFKGFSASGPVDKKSLEEFNKLYQERSKKATSLDAFSSDVLSDVSLGIDDGSTAQ